MLFLFDETDFVAYDRCRSKVCAGVRYHGCLCVSPYTLSWVTAVISNRLVAGMAEAFVRVCLTFFAWLVHAFSGRLGGM